MSEVFTADATTIYMFINFYHGKQLILGYCYGGEEQDIYGAQIMIRSVPLEYSALQVRGLWEGIWGDWKNI